MNYQPWALTNGLQRMRSKQAASTQYLWQLRGKWHATDLRAKICIPAPVPLHPLEAPNEEHREQSQSSRGLPSHSTHMGTHPRVFNVVASHPRRCKLTENDILLDATLHTLHAQHLLTALLAHPTRQTGHVHQQAAHQSAIEEQPLLGPRRQDRTGLALAHRLCAAFHDAAKGVGVHCIGHMHGQPATVASRMKRAQECRQGVHEPIEGEPWQ